MQANVAAATLTHIVKRCGTKVALDDATLAIGPGQVAALSGAWPYLAAEMVLATLFAATVAVPLMALATVAGGVTLTMLRLSVLFGLAVLGVIPFSAMLNLTCLPMLAQTAHAVVGTGQVSGIAGQLPAMATAAVVCFSVARRPPVRCALGC